MATLVSGRRTPWVRGPTAVIDAYVLAAVTTKYGVYFERVVAYKVFAAEGVHPIIDPIGASIDQVLDGGVAIAATFAQDTGKDGLLVNSMDFTVLIATTSEGGDVTDTITVTIQEIRDMGAGGVEQLLQESVNAIQGHGPF